MDQPRLAQHAKVLRKRGLGHRAVVDLLEIRAGLPSIINIGSVITRIVPPASAVYAGSKGAVDTITAVLAQELGPRRIRVNAVNPGMVETEGTHAAGVIGSELEAGAKAKTPLGRIGQPQDIASIVTFLASDDSYWLNGEQLVASGGVR